MRETQQVNAFYNYNFTFVNQAIKTPGSYLYLSMVSQKVNAEARV